jgi:hypothetical protein
MGTSTFHWQSSDGVDLDHVRRRDFGGATGQAARLPLSTSLRPDAPPG